VGALRNAEERCVVERADTGERAFSLGKERLRFEYVADPGEGLLIEERRADLGLGRRAPATPAAVQTKRVRGLPTIALVRRAAAS
jgi:hypothetical protein